MAVGCSDAAPPRHTEIKPVIATPDFDASADFDLHEQLDTELEAGQTSIQTKQLSAATLKSLSRKKAANHNTTHAVASDTGGAESKRKKRGRPKHLISFDDDEHFGETFTDDGSDASSTRGIDIHTPTSAPAPRTGKLKFTFEGTSASSAVVPNRHRAHVSNYKAPKDRVIASYKGSSELQPLDNPGAHLRTVNEKVSSGQWEAQKAGLEIVSFFLNLCCMCSPYRLITERVAHTCIH